MLMRLFTLTIMANYFILRSLDQLPPIISYLEERIAKAGEYSSDNEDLLYQGIKSAFRDTRKLIEEAHNEDAN